jgi:hypothetical protein
VAKLRSAGTSATRGGRPREAPGDSDLGRRLGLENRSERRPVESGDCAATGQDLPCQRKAHSAWCQLEPAIAVTVPSSRARRARWQSSGPLRLAGESAPPSSCRHRDSSLAVTLGRQLSRWPHIVVLSRQSLRVMNRGPLLKVALPDSEVALSGIAVPERAQRALAPQRKDRDASHGRCGSSCITKEQPPPARGDAAASPPGPATSILRMPGPKAKLNRTRRTQCQSGSPHRR